MQLGEYITKLEQIMDSDPEAAKLQVVHSSDDEGNNFTPVVFAPAQGVFDGDEFKYGPGVEGKYNAVCID